MKLQPLLVLAIVMLTAGCSVAPSASHNSVFIRKVDELNAILTLPAIKQIAVMRFAPTGMCTARLSQVWSEGSRLDVQADFASGIDSVEYMPARRIKKENGMEVWKPMVNVAFYRPMKMSSHSIDRVTGQAKNRDYEFNRIGLTLPDNIDSSVIEKIVGKVKEIQQECGQRDKVLSQAELPLSEVHKLAAAGDQTATHDLCYRYRYGRGAPLDHAIAREWCTKGAEQGVDSSQVLLAEMYYLGQGVPKDFAKALPWYQAAASQGHEHAMFMLYLIHDKGNGVKQDQEKALSYLRDAADAGYPKATAEMKKRGLSSKPE